MSQDKAAKAAYDRAYRARNKERIAQNKRDYTAVNFEREQTRVAAWVEANRGRSAEIKRAWKDRNPEHAAQYQAAHSERIQSVRAARRKTKASELSAKQREYAQRPEVKARIAEWARAYRIRHPEVHRNTMRTRRRGVSHATPPWADRAAIKAIYVAARAASMDVDHIVPLRSEIVCGLHVETNLQLLTPQANKQKGNSHAT